MKYWWSVALLLLVAIAQARETQALLSNLEAYSSEQQIRIQLTLNRKVPITIPELGGSVERFAVDLANTRLSSSAQLPTLPAGAAVRKIRSGIRKGIALRIVLDLQPRAGVTYGWERHGRDWLLQLHISVPAGERSASTDPVLSPQALLDGVLPGDIPPSAATVPSPKPSPPVKPAPASKPVVRPAVKTLPLKERDVIIAIDAGHGGHDPGAVVRSSVYEKTLVLKIARRLTELIKAERGYSAYLIRSRDESVSLGRRVRRARASDADFFISIHADSAPPSARGASAYSLSSRGASSVRARMLAASHNKSDDLLRDISEEVPGTRDVAQTVVDMSVEGAKALSAEAAEVILKRIRQIARVHKRGTGYANFAVLRIPNTPSVLVEAGYITNKHDLRNLQSSVYQKKMARAIFLGIQDYFALHPPPDTYVARVPKATTKTHRVKRGDTLSRVARRFGVRVSSLKSANKIRGSRIRAGQMLVIPDQ